VCHGHRGLVLVRGSDLMQLSASAVRCAPHPPPVCALAHTFEQDVCLGISAQRSIRSMHDACKGRLLVQASSSSSCCDKAPPTPDGDSSSSHSRAAVLAPRTLSRRGILTRRAAVVWLHALPKGIRRELLTSRAAAMAPRTTTAAGNRLTNYKFCKCTIATDGFASAP